jgi:hypothetical protein
MQFNQAPDQSQSQSKAAILAVCRNLCLHEQVEEVLNHVWIEAHAIVDDLDVRGVIGHAGENRDVAAGWRIPGRVAQQIRYYLN